ncbi:hypothetical protein Ade02nite_19030 [Paractinoplanes deccanensis]|uniref:Uncharacterized protein n=1 Tax=Paractinoplanes deccanensis TaxID=113561 RepID=A0ABQ3XZS8_9ACTN|nr:hypothetical protein Ade02nite_19030 [Actinoplanes deccanensis]
MVTTAVLPRHLLAPADVPLKCASENAARSPAVKCDEPGSLLRCPLCPASSTYWRNAYPTTPEGGNQ